jgi:uncharacterized protein YkwD
MPPLRALFALLLLAAPLSAQAGQLEDEVLAELNYARAHPARYAQELRRADNLGYEDQDAVDDAIGFLMNQPPLPPLRHHQGLTAAADAYARAQSRRGDEGHGRAAEDLGRRLQRQGVWAGLTAENISYGYDRPRDVVLQLIVDSRVPSRGHRKTIFGRNFQVAGVACGPHAAYGAMCVIDFAGALVER